MATMATNRTGYNLESGMGIGERKYGAPPPNWNGDAPGDGCEVYVGNLPIDMYEDTLIPIFEQIGKVYEMRLKMDPNSGLGRGYCFVVFSSKDEAMMCVRQMKSYEIAPNHFLKVNINFNNCRLLIGNVPKDKDQEELLGKFGSIVKHMKNPIMYNTPGSNKANRGFCFLEFESHNAASDAKRKLLKVQVWNRKLVVSWADTLEEPDEKKREIVKTRYVKGIVKEILEEGAVVIRGPPKNGPPAERIIDLSNIETPRIARRPTPSN
jgi:Q family heterogeneous nuclear ribonucleoprotein R